MFLGWVILIFLGVLLFALWLGVAIFLVFLGAFIVFMAFMLKMSQIKFFVVRKRFRRARRRL